MPEPNRTASTATVKPDRPCPNFLPFRHANRPGALLLPGWEKSAHKRSEGTGSSRDSRSATPRAFCAGGSDGR